VRFHHGQEMFEATFETVGLSIDAAATLDAARKVAHEGAWWRRIREGERARRGEIEVPLVWALDEAKARALLSTFAPALARAPVDARIDLTRHERIPDEPGRELDVDDLDVRELRRDGALDICGHHGSHVGSGHDRTPPLLS